MKYCCHSNILCWVAKHKATCRFSTYLTVRVVGFGHTSSWTQKKPERARPINTTALCGILVVSPDSHTWIRARSSMNARRLASFLAASSEEIPASPPGCTVAAITALTEAAAGAAAATEDVALEGEDLGCHIRKRSGRRYARVGYVQTKQITQVSRYIRESSCRRSALGLSGGRSELDRCYLNCDGLTQRSDGANGRERLRSAAAYRM